MEWDKSAESSMDDRREWGLQSEQSKDDSSESRELGEGVRWPSER